MWKRWQWQYLNISTRTLLLSPSISLSCLLVRSMPNCRIWSNSTLWRVTQSWWAPYQLKLILHGSNGSENPSSSSEPSAWLHYFLQLMVFWMVSLPHMRGWLEMKSAFLRSAHLKMKSYNLTWSKLNFEIDHNNQSIIRTQARIELKNLHYNHRHVIIIIICLWL